MMFLAWRDICLFYLSHTEFSNPEYKISKQITLTTTRMFLKQYNYKPRSGSQSSGSGQESTQAASTAATNANQQSSTVSAAVAGRRRVSSSTSLKQWNLLISPVICRPAICWTSRIQENFTRRNKTEHFRATGAVWRIRADVEQLH